MELYNYHRNLKLNFGIVFWYYYYYFGDFGWGHIGLFGSGGCIRRKFDRLGWIGGSLFCNLDLGP